ncbi:hypothetical protein C5S53_17605 [Methanophagales archaeon]|jgi:hypothetical protein|nr:hypothetical protein C5S53_17605 [Methanophagales archaeon]
MVFMKKSWNEVVAVKAGYCTHDVATTDQKIKIGGEREKNEQ